MKIEKTEFGLKATIPLITEDEMKIINNDFDNTITKFLDMIIKDKDLATAQYIIKKQQEQIKELEENSIPKKKIKDKIKELEHLIEEVKDVVGLGFDCIEYKGAIKILQELLEDK